MRGRLISFPYQIQRGYPRPLPICDITLLGPQREVQLLALVDSGACDSVFLLSAAQDAGIDLARAGPQPIQYGNSEATGLRIKVQLRLQDELLCAEVVFVERLNFGWALLGRQGVFAHFGAVAFVENEKVRTPRVEFRGY